MKFCENCKCEILTNYGSNRFCSSKCARGFSTKNKRSEINKKVSEKLTKYGDIKLTCKNCEKEFMINYRKKNQKFCSISCSIKFRDTGKISSDKTREKISNSIKELYKNGKNVLGGKTKWYTYKNIKVQGTYELRTCIILDLLKDKGDIYDWDYTGDRISYRDINNKNRTYLLDFKVFSTPGSFYYIETKGYLTDNDYLKWAATRKKYQLVIWLDKDIKEMEKKLGII